MLGGLFNAFKTAQWAHDLLSGAAFSQEVSKRKNSDLVGALQKKPLARQDDILRNSELINSHLEDIPEPETKAVQEASENLSRSNLESKSRAQRSKVCG